METLIVGAGTMGKWFGSCINTDIAFLDTDQQKAKNVATTVMNTTTHRVRAVKPDTEESFGLVCFAVPMSEIETAIERHATKAQQAVIDLTGKMEDPVSLMANIAPARERASLHPLFHPDNAPGQIAIAIQTQGPVIDRIQDTFRDQGYTFTEISPEEHDTAMKTIQGRTHAAILAFAMTADSVPDGLETPVYRRLRSLMIDILDNNPEIYAEIQAEFDGADDIAQAAAEIGTADYQQFLDMYTNVSRDT